MNAESQASEILINASRVDPEPYSDLYEFVLDDKLNAIECVHIESLIQGIVVPVKYHAIKNILFELNHIRVNPRLDNTHMTEILSHALKEIGISLNQPPAQNTIAMCFKPLGEISGHVRFYLDGEGQVIFLTPDSVKLHVIRNRDNLTQLPRHNNFRGQHPDGRSN
jgi:hypothetical protein